MVIPKIQFRDRGIMDIIWWTREADVFCWHLKHWKEAENSARVCNKHKTWWSQRQNRKGVDTE